MLTVKLCRGHHTKLVEANEVNIYPRGPKRDDPDTSGPNAIREIAAKLGDDCKTFLVMNCNDEGIAFAKKEFGKDFRDSTDIFDVAYIANEKGSTVDVIRPY